MPLTYSADQPPSEARMAPLTLVPSSLSRKVMEAENREVGDATTLADSNVMALITSGISTAKGED
jgi:hypothetical protein